MSGGYTCLAPRASFQRRDSRDSRLGAREAAGRRPRGCVRSPRLEDITRLSAGGRRREFRRGSRRRPRRGGDSRPQSVLCSTLPPELEPMDWRQLRSSARQSRGSGSGWGPRARVSMGRLTGRSRLEHPGRWLLVWGLSFRSEQQGKSCLSCPLLGLAVGLDPLFYGRANLEAGVVGIPTTKFGGLPGPFQARAVIASPRIPSDPD